MTLARPAVALAALALLASTMAARVSVADTRAAPPAPSAAPARAQPAQATQPPAQAPPPGYAPPPPGYAPPPPGYAPPPPGYAPYYYGAPPSYYGVPQVPPRPQKERYSTGMMVTGIVLAGVGVVSLLAGSVVFAAAEERQNHDDILCDSSIEGNCSFRDDNDEDKTAGIALMIAGGVGVAVGVPLLIVGARKVPVEQPAAALTRPSPALQASLRVGPRAAALRFAF